MQLFYRTIGNNYYHSYTFFFLNINRLICPLQYPINKEYVKSNIELRPNKIFMGIFSSDDIMIGNYVFCKTVLFLYIFFQDKDIQIGWFFILFFFDV